MRSELTTWVLEDCLEALIDYRGKTPKKTESGIPLITAKVVKSGRIESPNEFIAPEDFGSWMTRGLPKVGDVVMTTEAPLGEVGQLQKLPVALAQRIVTLRGKSGVLHNDYLLYALQSEPLQAQLRERASGTTVVGIKQSELRKVRLGLPSFETQCEVASVLKALDARIDLLRQTNATLESIAQALFKSWFIDFDPVRAKAEGREPDGMDAATAALFPAEFEESALGLIPKGWKAGRFGDLAELAKGSVNPLNAPHEEFEHYSLPAFDAAQLPVLERGETIKSNKTRVPAGAVLQSKLNPHIPRVWWPSRIGERAVCSTEFLPWVAKRGTTSELVYCTLTAPSFAEAVRTLVTGTSNSHQRVRPDQVAGIQLVSAPGDISNAFSQVVRPLLSKVGENRLLAKTLAKLRDALLPRLISGKLRLPEAQAQLEEAIA